MDADKIQKQVADKAGIGDAKLGGGTIFTEQVLVVNQKAKLFEGSSNFSVFRADGSQIGSVRQVGQSKAGKLLKALSNLDAMMSARFEITDKNDVLQLVVAKPRTFIKGHMSVERADGTEIGKIEQKLRLGKAKFLLKVGDEQVGEIDAENFRAWNFRITEAGGAEVARITKTWAGLGKEMFTNADNYVLEISRPLSDPLHSLAIASALTIDQLLKQFKS